MNERHLYFLLRVIKNNSNIKQLLNEGLTYPRIAQLTEEAIKQEFIIYEQGNIKLSAKGIEKHKYLEAIHKKTNKAEWILPALESKVSKISKNDIFLPDQKELSF